MQIKHRFPFIPGLAHRAGVLLTALVLTACGEQQQQAQPNDDSLQQSQALESEIRYVRGANEFESGVAQVKATRPFRSFGLKITADPASVFEYQVLSTDGTWSGWVSVKLDENNGRYRGGHQVLSAPATQVRIRASVPAEFLRFELFPGTEELHDDDPRSHDHGLGELGQQIARPGIWAPSAETLHIGDGMYVPYEPADSCYGSLRPGTQELGEFILSHFPGISYYGGYNCRSIVGQPGVLSVHATGRALDIFVPVDGDSGCSTCADNDKGDPLAKWLMENAEYIGFSLVIWDRADWGAHRASGSKYGSYGGTHPHHDHLHIEITSKAAARQTRWFLDGKPWNQGTDTFTGHWYLRDFNSAGASNIPGIAYGGPGDIPKVGDWDGNGTDTVGVYRNGVWYLRNSNTAGSHTVPSFTYGGPGDIPVVGDWNNDGIDTVGVVRNGVWYLRNSNTAGPHTITSFAYGTPGIDIFVVGDWNADGTDTVGVAR